MKSLQLAFMGSLAICGALSAGSAAAAGLTMCDRSDAKIKLEGSCTIKAVSVSEEQKAAIAAVKNSFGSYQMLEFLKAPNKIDWYVCDGISAHGDARTDRMAIFSYINSEARVYPEIGSMGFKGERLSAASAFLDEKSRSIHFSLGSYAENVGPEGPFPQLDTLEFDASNPRKLTLTQWIMSSSQGAGNVRQLVATIDCE